MGFLGRTQKKIDFIFFHIHKAIPMTNDNTNDTMTEMVRISEPFMMAMKLIKVCRFIDTDDYEDEACPFSEGFWEKHKDKTPTIPEMMTDLEALVSGVPFSTMEFYTLNELGSKYLPHDRLECMYSFTDHPQLCVMWSMGHHDDFKNEKEFLKNILTYCYVNADAEFFKRKDTNFTDDFNKYMMNKLYKISTCSYTKQGTTRHNPLWVGNGKWVFNGLAYQHYVLNNEAPEDEYDLKWEEGAKATFNPMGFDIAKYLEHQSYRSLDTFCCCLFPYESIVLDKTLIHFGWERDKTIREMYNCPEDFVKSEFGDDTPDYNKLKQSNFSFSSYPPVPVSAL